MISLSLKEKMLNRVKSEFISEIESLDLLIEKKFKRSLVEYSFSLKITDEDLAGICLKKEPFYPVPRLEAFIRVAKTYLSAHDIINKKTRISTSKTDKHEFPYLYSAGITCCQIYHIDLLEVQK